MTRTDTHSDTDGAQHSPNTFGINPDDREQVLLDEIRVEQKRTREEMQRQNHLLEQLLQRLETADTEKRGRT